MSLRLDSTEPEEMSPDERLEEIADIFARGIIRLHGRVIPDASDSEILPDSPRTCLEPVAPPRPDGAAG